MTSLSGLFFLALALVWVAVALTALIVFLHSRMVIRPPRLSDGKALAILNRLGPEDVGLAFEPMRFRTSDGLNLAAWWMPCEGADRTVIHVHGYASAKVATLAWSPLWHDLGFNILALDLRAHGESDGRFTTAGYLERDDLDAVINELRAARPEATRRLVLCGNSMGAAVVAATAVRREDIDLVVLDSPIAHFARGVRAHADLLGAPLPTLTPVVMKLAGWQAGADWDAVAPVNTIGGLACPLLLVLPEDDAYLTPGDAEALTSAAETAGGTVLRLPGGHMLSYAEDPPAYRAALEAAISRLPAPGPRTRRS